MTTICLIRHGETDWNASQKLQGATDIPLNTTGILQAEECAAFLESSQWDVIITSPLTRAKQTAEIINEKLNIPFAEMAAFKEKSFGDAEGTTPQERLERFPDKIFPNQEDEQSFKERIITGIHEINQTYQGSMLLLVAHGAVINSILGTISNGEIGAGKTKLVNACISNIYFQEEKWNVRDFNQVSHLSG
ncbi:histidine phosphatase family protein [Virgibacillus subterraneus]|uniref:histidine phosphatase family protein n=1 Tax=Virgibacillus subterraneus TaxID=621109 RepID=UPI000B897E1E|nr:histidine phosphatase family protein [Virgibacillus subterraneus]